MTDARGWWLDIERQLLQTHRSSPQCGDAPSAPFLLPIRRRTTPSRTGRRRHLCPGDPRRSHRRCPIDMFWRIRERQVISGPPRLLTLNELCLPRCSTVTGIVIEHPSSSPTNRCKFPSTSPDNTLPFESNPVKTDRDSFNSGCSGGSAVNPRRGTGWHLLLV
jgi:hypothetical protein